MHIRTEDPAGEDGERVPDVADGVGGEGADVLPGVGAWDEDLEASEAVVEE